MLDLWHPVLADVRRAFARTRPAAAPDDPSELVLEPAKGATRLSLRQKHLTAPVAVIVPLGSPKMLEIAIRALARHPDFGRTIAGDRP